MFRKISLLGLFLPLLACGPREADARAHLEKRGLTVRTLTKQENGFAFTATKGKELCSGSVNISKGIGSSSTFETMSCERDVSACKPGAAAQCMEIASDLYGQEANVFPSKAAELYRIACADGNGEACGRVSEFETIKKEWALVREFGKKGCDLGSGEACRWLGLTESEGHGTPKNEAKAIELLEKACELSSMAGCRAAAGLMVDAEPSQAEAAIPLAEKACAVKFKDSCFVLGAALFNSKKRYTVALEHLDAACTDEKLGKQQGYACNLAGAIAFDGLGMRKDAKRALGYLERSCDKNFREGCLNAGRIHSSGAGGVRADKKKGAELLSKACTLGEKAACS